MQLFSTYRVKIKHFNHIFKKTVEIYRNAVDYLIFVCNANWDKIAVLQGKKKLTYVENLIHATKGNLCPKYDFDKKFYKLPSYLRRGAINEALGKVSSYQRNLANWEQADHSIRGKAPSLPKAGFVYPCMYKTVMYQQTDTDEAKIKVFIRSTWDWLTVSLRKSDMDYINRHCKDGKICAPTLQKRGHEWFLDFPFEETITLQTKDIFHQTVLAVDLGIHSCAAVSVMKSDGAVLERHFLKLSKEYDCLYHAVNRIKKAQQNGNRKTPGLWAKAKGINRDIAVKTANFIMETAQACYADVIVFEHLDRTGKKRGTKKQRLHLWRSQYVQAIAEHKAHRLGMRMSRICAWNTSRLAYDGSGFVYRGKDAGFAAYSVCRFQNGKVYNCDLSASYNIGSRYFVREILKSLPAKERLALEAKVPQAAKRSTCTLSALINLNAELMAVTA